MPRRPVELLPPRPRRLPRLAIAASAGLHLVLFLTVTIEGRLARAPALPPPVVRVVELPPYQVMPVRPPDRVPPPERRPEVLTPSARASELPVAIAEPVAGDPEVPADTAETPAAPGMGRLGPGLARGRLWVRPLPLPPRELAQRLTSSHTELVDSAVTAIIQTFLDSVALDPRSRAATLPSWTTTVAGSKFGLDSKWIYVAGLRIPAAVLALLPIPARGNESRAFDRSGEMYQDLQRAAQRAANVDEFKDAIREIRERREREREFERNQRTQPEPRPSLEPDE